MLGFLLKRKLEVLSGLGIVGAVSVTSVVLVNHSSAYSNREDEDYEDRDAIPINPKLTSHSYLNVKDDQLATTGSKLTEKGYTKVSPGINFATSDLGWSGVKDNYYNKLTIANKLKSEQNARLISGNADASVWTAMSLVVLNDHSTQEDDYLKRYSDEFRLVVMDMKHHWQDRESKKVSWGQNLRNLCTTSYHTGYDENRAKDKLTLESVSKLCQIPTSNPELLEE